MKILVLFEGPFLQQDQLQLISKLSESYALSIHHFDPMGKFNLVDASKIIRTLQNNDEDAITVVFHQKAVDEYEEPPEGISHLLLNSREVIECYPTTPDELILKSLSDLSDREDKREENDRVKGFLSQVPKWFRATVHIVWVLTKAAWVASISYSIMMLLKYIAQ